METDEIIQSYQKQSKRHMHEIKELQIQNESLRKERDEAIQNIIKVREEFTKQVKELQEELKTVKIKYDRLRNQKGNNPLGSGRKSMDELWRTKIEDCWKSGMKDKEIYGWLTCTDEKGQFHILSESTYYRFKRKYYKTFKINFDRKNN